MRQRHKRGKSVIETECKDVCAHARGRQGLRGMMLASRRNRNHGEAAIA
jgi:hypothetical protein